MSASFEQIAEVVRQCLEQGAQVEIDGLGVFRAADSGFEFVPQTKPRVFIAYVEEDYFQALRLYQLLAMNGFDPWLDKMKLLPGQNWPRAIEQAIRVSDFFLACFSKRTETKRGVFHSELRFALECASRVPIDEIFLIPVRLENCRVPQRITNTIQYLDLFPYPDKGFLRLVEMLNRNRRSTLESASV